MTAAAIVLATLIKGIVILTFVSLVVAFSVWAERRIIGRMQARIGPNRVGPFGLLQPFADIIKLFFKEDFTPPAANRFLFFIAPISAVMIAFITLTVLPFGPRLPVDFDTSSFPGLLLYHLATPVLSDLDNALLFLLAVSGVGILTIIFGGW